jgi:predicted  nucleic acid-binding Zn-ribbon protein
MSKETYKLKAEAKIEEGQAKLSEARGAAVDARIKAEQQISDLEMKLGAAKSKLAKINDAAEGAWEDLSKGFDDAWEDISGDIKKVFSNFKY